MHFLSAIIKDSSLKNTNVIKILIPLAKVMRNVFSYEGENNFRTEINNRSSFL